MKTGRGVERERTLRRGRESVSPILEPPGWRALIPGLSQWQWGQRARGTVLLGSFLSAAGAAAFAWGTAGGLALLGFAFVAHVVALVDAWNQAAFPPMWRWAPWVTAVTWLTVGVYAPVLGIASLLAWPGDSGGSAAEGYLVNCWAYRSAAPRAGDWVWYRSTDWGAPRLGRVVAGAGHAVEWSENRLRVDGRPVRVPMPFQPAQAPRNLSYRVPEGHVLVNAEGAARTSDRLVILGCERVVGRAWAQFYPVTERRLLD